MRFQISDGKSQFSGSGPIRRGHIWRLGKINKPEKKVRRIRDPKWERRASHSTLRKNCTYNYSAKGCLTKCLLPV